jgi:uncharacterized protein (TIGR01777 family)
MRSRVCVLGASGFLGQALCQSLRARGDSVLGVGRSGVVRDGEWARWDPARGELDPALLEGATAVINLAGENLAGGRWNAARKRVLVDSRVGSTALLCQRLAQLQQPPKVLLNASAVGFYGAGDEAAADETSVRGEGFLAELCAQWEAATEPARVAGLRVVRMRFGVVLAAGGGALARMLPPFRLGLGGRLGDGTQAMPWIGLEDCVRAVLWCLDRPALSGPVNVVAPGRLDNSGFVQALGRAVHRPAVLPVPAAALRLLLGETADELLLRGRHVLPGVLLRDGFQFAHPDIDSALAAELAAIP